MRKLIMIATAIGVLALPAASMAAAPDGQFAFKNNADHTSHGSVIGQLSSQIKQNGQFVSGQDNAYGIDQTTTPGSRAAAVQSLLGH